MGDSPNVGEAPGVMKVAPAIGCFVVCCGGEAKANRGYWLDAFAATKVRRKYRAADNLL
jgi:hypothetical protein